MAVNIEHYHECKDSAELNLDEDGDEVGEGRLADEDEMGLDAGEYVEVKGRGGGEGWVIAVRRRVEEDEKGLRVLEGGVGDGEGGWEEEGERRGLVPEGYLEKVRDVL